VGRLGAPGGAWTTDHSRFAYIEQLADEKTAISTYFLIRAAGWFERHGVTVAWW